jgi:hypothetical protein
MFALCPLCCVCVWQTERTEVLIASRPRGIRKCLYGQEKYPIHSQRRSRNRRFASPCPTEGPVHTRTTCCSVFPSVSQEVTAYTDRAIHGSVPIYAHLFTDTFIWPKSWLSVEVIRLLSGLRLDVKFGQHRKLLKGSNDSITPKILEAAVTD